MKLDKASKNQKDALPGLFENRMTVTVAEMAAALGKTPGALYVMCHRRQIPFRKVGRRVMFIPREISAWLQKHRSH